MSLRAAGSAALLGPCLHGLVGLWLAGCASAADAPAWRTHPSPGLGDAPVRSEDAAPYAPRSDARDDGGATVAKLLIDEAQARQTALAFATALLDADPQALSLLLDEQVALIAQGARKPRREVVEACLGDARAIAYRHERIESVVDLARLTVYRGGSEGLPQPPGTDGSDLAVQLNPLIAVPPGGQRIACLGTVYVRPGPRAVVVALVR